MATKAELKLTHKQESFALNVARGMTLMDAYRNAYNAGNMSDKSISVEAARLMTDPRITLVVEREKSRIQDDYRTTTISDRDRVLEKLRVLMDSAGTETVQLNAAIALGKSVALFTDVVEERDRKTVAEIEAELESILGGNDPKVVPIRG